MVFCFLAAAAYPRVIYAQDKAAWPLTPQDKEKVLEITISEGIDRVVKDSRLIKISSEERNMAFEDTIAARSAFLPQLNSSLTQTYLSNQPAAKIDSLKAFTADRQSLSYGWDIYQTIFDFGKSFSDYKAAKSLLSSSKTNMERVKNLAVLEFIAAYFDLLDAGKMILVLEQEVGALTSYMNDVEHLYEAGAALKNDLLPAKVKLADAKQRLISLRNLKDNAAARLNNILALPLKQKITAKDIEMNFPQMPDIEYAFKTAEAQRAEIKIIDEQIKVSSMIEKSRLAANYPKFFADGGYSYAQNEYQAEQDNYFLNLGVKLNIFDGWISRAEAAKERHRQARLSEQKKKLIEDIQLEVQNSYLALRDAIERVSVSKDALEQAGENVRTARVKFAEGSATSSEVLDAITMQAGARTNYYKADYELKRGYARLMYSMGIDLALVYGKMESKDDGTKKQQ